MPGEDTLNEPTAAPRLESALAMRPAQEAAAGRAVAAPVAPSWRLGAGLLALLAICLVPAERPQRRAQAEPNAAPPTAKAALGLGVADLTDAQKQELGVKGGVRVESADGAAARAGLRAGDVILQIANAEVTDSKQFVALAAKAEKERTVSVLVRRGNWVNYLLIRPR